MNPKSKVLIVDDEPRNRALLEAILKPLGYEIVLAVDGQEALEKTLETRPDIILLDVMMPDITGYEVCETIRQDPDLAEIPVLLVTALDDRESRIRGIEAGADDFLTKPVDAVEIQARVKTVMRLNRYRRLLAEREKFLKIGDFSTDALLLLGDDSRIHYANARASNWLGLKTDALPKVSFPELAGSRFQLQPTGAWDRWREAAPPEDRQLRYLVGSSGSGPALWLQAQVFSLPETGGGDWLVRLQDVSGLVGQRREQWSFHRMLSHKMRTPLNGLIGSLNSLIASDDVAPGSETAATLNDALISAVRFESQVKDVLMYLDAPKLSKLGEALSASMLGGRATEIARRMGLMDPQVRVAADCAGRTLALGTMATDVVLTELFENSLKFHPRMSPRITVDIQSVEAGRVEIVVTDDGETLTEAALADAPRPYFQSEAKLTGEVAGMGLGLSMVSQMLWEVGGEFALGNGPDGGVRATIRVPSPV